MTMRNPAVANPGAFAGRRAPNRAGAPFFLSGMAGRE